MVRGLLACPPEETRRLYADHVNPTMVEALGLLGYGRDFVRGEGVTLWDAEGRAYRDFLAGYGTLLLGHNHPEVRDAIAEVLRAGVPQFVQVSPQPLAGALAARLARLAPGGLDIAYLMSSGSEAVDGALKLARAATRRPRFVSAERAFHGITFGALSVTGHDKHRAPFEPLLPDTARVPWGDAGAIEKQLRRRDVAAVILETMQGEGGFRPAPAGYLADVRRLCHRYGTLLVLDEVQVGLGRTGRMFAYEREGVAPDVLVLAKGLSGGLVPVSAILSRRDVWTRAYGSLTRYDVHASTFSGGALAAAAALATLEVLERDRLPARAEELGERLGRALRAAVGGHPMVRDIRGRGLLWGVELFAPGGELGAMAIGQWVAVGLMQRGIVSQVGTQAPDVIRAEPPLIAREEDVDAFARALGETLREHAPSALAAASGAARSFVTAKLTQLRAGGQVTNGSAQEQERGRGNERGREDPDVAIQDQHQGPIASARR
jgi:putrescine aminotransferase